MLTPAQAWTEKATSFCERFPNPRSAEEVQRNLEAVQHALREREKRQGASIEEIAKELNRKKENLDTVKGEIIELNNLNKVRDSLGFPFLPNAILTLQTGPEGVRESSLGPMARVPPPHRASMQGVLRLPPF